MGKKGAIDTDIVIWLVIGVVVLVLVLIGFGILGDKGMGAINYVKNLFRFGS